MSQRLRQSLLVTWHAEDGSHLAQFHMPGLAAWYDVAMEGVVCVLLKQESVEPFVACTCGPLELVYQRATAAPAKMNTEAKTKFTAR